MLIILILSIGFMYIGEKPIRKLISYIEGDLIMCLDSMSEEDLVSQGILKSKRSKWPNFTDWKRNFKKNNPEKLKGLNGEQRRAIYCSELRKQGIPVRMMT